MLNDFAKSVCSPNRVCMFRNRHSTFFLNDLDISSQKIMQKVNRYTFIYVGLFNFQCVFNMSRPCEDSKLISFKWASGGTQIFDMFLQTLHSIVWDFFESGDLRGFLVRSARILKFTHVQPDNNTRDNAQQISKLINNFLYN